MTDRNEHAELRLLPRHGFWPSAQDKHICGRQGCFTRRSHPIHTDNDQEPARVA